MVHRPLIRPWPLLLPPLLELERRVAVRTAAGDVEHKRLPEAFDHLGPTDELFWWESVVRLERGLEERLIGGGEEDVVFLGEGEPGRVVGREVA